MFNMYEGSRTEVTTELRIMEDVYRTLQHFKYIGRTKTEQFRDLLRNVTILNQKHWQTFSLQQQSYLGLFNVINESNFLSHKDVEMEIFSVIKKNLQTTARTLQPLLTKIWRQKNFNKTGKMYKIGFQQKDILTSTNNFKAICYSMYQQKS